MRGSISHRRLYFTFIKCLGGWHRAFLSRSRGKRESLHPFRPHRFPAGWESEDLHFSYLGWRREIPFAGNKGLVTKNCSSQAECLRPHLLVKRRVSLLGVLLCPDKVLLHPGKWLPGLREAVGEICCSVTQTWTYRGRPGRGMLAVSK